MKKTLLSLLLCAATFCASFAQTIPIGIAIPTSDTSMDAATSKALVNKVQAILTKNGMGDSGSDFVLVPSIQIDEDDIIESGMVNLFKVAGSLNLALTQISTDKVFGSVSIPIRGTGKRSKATAMKSAASSVNVNNPDITRFLEQSKQNVIDYYTKNHSSIIGKARTAASTGDYDQALAILASFPDGMPREKEINAEIEKTYKLYLTHNCREIILQAKGALAKKEYDYANSLLADIDPNSPCYSDAVAMTNSMSKEIRQTEAQERAAQERREQRALDLQKTRINAVRDVAKAYYQRTYPKYTVVFR
ncbi:MAG: hypothetical protein NC210_03855 [[Clostridium] fimetarium]|nr:hypothetical protein [Alistipes timonensis]MCM1405539.1 hypothetical protein [[Clostridium] fimetarium]